METVWIVGWIVFALVCIFVLLMILLRKLPAIRSLRRSRKLMALVYFVWAIAIVLLTVGGLFKDSH